MAEAAGVGATGAGAAGGVAGATADAAGAAGAAGALDVAPLIHAHPTMSEALGEAHLALAGKPLHAHG